MSDEHTFVPVFRTLEVEDSSDNEMDEVHESHDVHDIKSIGHYTNSFPLNVTNIENSFGDMITSMPSDQSVNNRILVVLDCANIGWFYGNGKCFSSQGLINTFEYFSKIPIECELVAFIPSSYVRKKPTDGTTGNTKMKTEELEHLESLILNGKISVVPAGNILSCNLSCQCTSLLLYFIFQVITMIPIY